MIPIRLIRRGAYWFILAVILDLCHYHVWGLFRAQDQVYVYDSIDLIKGFFYLYAGTQVFKELNSTSKVICNTIAFYFLIDVVTFIYDFDGVLASMGEHRELYTFVFSIFYLVYVQKERISLVFYETFGNTYHR